MSDDPEPPQNIHRLKPRESPPTPRPAAIGSSQPIDVRDLIRQGTTNGPVLSIRTPVKMPLDAEEKKMLFGLCVGAVLGQVLFWQGFPALITRLEATTWANAAGVIQSVGIKNIGYGLDMTFEPIVKYSYEVNGSHYFGNRVDLRDPRKFALEDATEVAERYINAKKVAVLYDPKNPQSALLETGGSTENWVKLVLGSLFTVVGVFAAAALWRSYRQAG